MKRLNYIFAILLSWPFAIAVQAQSLKECLIIAADSNPGLKAKYVSFEIAMQRVAQVNALPDPVLSFGYFIRPVETKVGPQLAKISLSQMFPWFGTLSAKGDVLSLEAQAKYSMFLEARNELFFNVKAAWFPLLETKEQIRLQRENLKILESYHQIALASYKNGKGRMADVLRVEVSIEQNETDIHLLEEKIHPLLTRINLLLNRADTSQIEWSEQADMLEIDSSYRKDSLFAANPMLQSYDYLYASAVQKETLARRQGMPGFGVGLDYVIVGKSNQNVTDNGKDAIMPMLSISLPVYRGKYNSGIREAEQLQQFINYQKEDYRNTLISNYQWAMYELNAAREQYMLKLRQKKKAEQVLHLLLSAYENSGSDFEEVLRSNQQIIQYEMNLVSLLSAFHTAKAKVDYLTAMSEEL